MRRTNQADAQRSSPITMGMVLARARDSASKCEAEVGETETPDLDRASVHIHRAFEAAMRVVTAADDEKLLSLIELADNFAELHEHWTRAERLREKGAFRVWIGQPGRAFAQFSGNSALDVLRSTLGSIYSALLVTIGYSTVHGQFPKAVLDLQISNPNQAPELLDWPERALRELRGRALPISSRWERARDAGILWSHFQDELQRTREFIQHLRSLQWYTLAVFGSRAVTPWTEDPEFRDPVQTLASRLRTAARSAGICDPNADDEVTFRCVLDWLVANAALSVSEANNIPVSDALRRLESAAPKKGRKLPKKPTDTERTVFSVIRGSPVPIKGPLIAVQARLREDVMYRACAFLTQRGFITNVDGGYQAVRTSLPD